MVISSRRQRCYRNRGRNQFSNQNSSSDEDDSEEEQKQNDNHAYDVIYSSSSSSIISSSSSSDGEESSDDDDDDKSPSDKGPDDMKVSRPARSFGSDDESSDFSAAPETDSDASESESNDDTNNQMKPLSLQHAAGLRGQCSPPRELALPITPATVLFSGLNYVGFDRKRQASAREDLNIRRFIAFYGAPPTALSPLFNDIRELFSLQCPSCEDLLMTCNWLKGYDVMHVLEGRWGYCEDYIRTRTNRCKAMLQALRRKKMKFEDSNNNSVIIGSLDTVSFTVQEFRLDPSSKWYDQKSHSAGLKYEFCVGTEEPAKQVWMNGPAPCGEIPDITLYRGGDEKTPTEDRDKSALYFQTPEGKMWVADSAYAGEYERIIVTMDEMSERDIKWLNRLKARGETLHGRLKSFNVLGNRFRHGKNTEDKIKHHQLATESVCLVVLYDCENGRPLFEQ